MGLLLNKWLNFIVTLCLIAVVFSSIPQTTGSDSQPASEYSDNSRYLEVKTNKMYYRPGEEVAITIQNQAKMDISFETNPKFVIKDENGNVVYPTSPLKRPMQQENYDINAEYASDSWTLAAGAKEMYRWDQTTITLPELKGGVYTIETVSTLPDYVEGITPIFIRERGYVLIVAGNNNDDLQDYINEACNTIYDNMIYIGYSADEIYYLNGWNNYRVDDIATSDKVEDAIKVWAADKVSPFNPLFIVFFDHGGVNNFCIDNTVVGNDNVVASDLDSWLDDLQEDTNTEVFMWYMGCHSGSFIDEVSADDRIIITSCRAAENSGTAPAPYREKMSSQYWPAIVAGDSLGTAFDIGSHYVAETLGAYHPLLDDNGDGVGHGWDTPDPSGYLPHDGDGSYADTVFMGGGDDEEEIIITDILARRAFEWPFPPEEITLEIQLDIDPKVLSGVIASMPLPDMAAGYDGNFLENDQYMDFEMFDADGDGTWTVNIPTETIMEYYMRPGEVQFIITAEDDRGHTSIPQTTSIEFTQDGNPSPDTTPPDIRILSPEPRGIVDGMGVLAAVASDDSCLDKAEIYINDILVDTVELPASSSNYFEYERDTSELPDGVYTLTVMVYDSSGNSFSKSIEITILNNPAGPAPASLKQEAITILEGAMTGEKKVDRLLEDAMDNIQASLDPDLWLDESHLDPQHGHKVPVREKAAMMSLWQLYRSKDASDEVKLACFNAALLLLECDHQLARTLYNEAHMYAGSNKVDRELCSAESAFDAAIEALTDENPNPEIKAFKAIDLYKKAMEHSELAVEFGSE